MSFEIIKDAEKGISAIVDPEVGRALGPIAFGDDAEKILEAFAGSFAGDITKHLPSEVERKWEEFVLTLSDVQDAVEGKPDVGVVEDPPTPDAAATSTTTSLSDTTAPSEPDVGVADPTPSPAQAPTLTDTTAPSDATAGAPAGPVTTPQAGNIVCPTCDGWRTIPSGDTEVECPTCKGTGEVLGEQPEPPEPDAA